MANARLVGCNCETNEHHRIVLSGLMKCKYVLSFFVRLFICFFVSFFLLVCYGSVKGEKENNQCDNREYVILGTISFLTFLEACGNHLNKLLHQF